MKLTRRDLGKLAAAAIPGAGAPRRAVRSAWAPARARSRTRKSPACRSA